MRRLWLILAALLVLAGCSTMQTVPAAEAPPINGLPITVTAPVADPVSISIPKLKVDDDIVPVGLAADGSMQVPPVTSTGWYEPGPAPGEVGIAVTESHVNYDGVPGAFSRIGELVTGDRITVVDRSGAVHVFSVFASVQIPKVDFAAKSVPLLFQSTDDVELALVTCAGKVSNHEYADNRIVSARLVTT
jgi:sortase (surface protein transpeptidase)